MNNARFYYSSRACNALGRVRGGGGKRLPVPWGILKINPLHSPWCFGLIRTTMYPYIAGILFPSRTYSHWLL